MAAALPAMSFDGHAVTQWVHVAAYTMQHSRCGSRSTRPGHPSTSWLSRSRYFWWGWSIVDSKCQSASTFGEGQARFCSAKTTIGWFIQPMDAKQNYGYHLFSYSWIPFSLWVLILERPDVLVRNRSVMLLEHLIVRCFNNIIKNNCPML
jgi:hypothetical protein